MGHLGSQIWLLLIVAVKPSMKNLPLKLPNDVSSLLMAGMNGSGSDREIRKRHIFFIKLLRPILLVYTTPAAVLFWLGKVSILSNIFTIANQSCYLKVMQFYFLRERIFFIVPRTRIFSFIGSPARWITRVIIYRVLLSSPSMTNLAQFAQISLSHLLIFGDTYKVLKWDLYKLR